jgi:hypothetical protein
MTCEAGDYDVMTNDHGSTTNGQTQAPEPSREATVALWHSFDPVDNALSDALVYYEQRVAAAQARIAGHELSIASQKETLGEANQFADTLRAALAAHRTTGGGA